MVYLIFNSYVGEPIGYFDDPVEAYTYCYNKNKDETNERRYRVESLEKFSLTGEEDTNFYYKYIFLFDEDSPNWVPLILTFKENDGTKFVKTNRRVFIAICMSTYDIELAVKTAKSIYETEESA